MTAVESQPTPPARKKQIAWLRLALQTVVTLGLVVLLVWLFRKYEVKDKLLAIRPADLVLAGAMILLACAVNTLLWQLLLRNVG
ncbi:MAG: hypothetical protein ACREIT_09860, partial [Tepidisphaeraceae bacterium]